MSVMSVMLMMSVMSVMSVMSLVSLVSLGPCVSLTTSQWCQIIALCRLFHASYAASVDLPRLTPSWHRRELISRSAHKSAEASCLIFLTSFKLVK